MAPSAESTPIEPFWRRLRQFWLYPLKGGPLATILVMALVQTFVSYLVLVGWLLGLLALAAVYRYAFMVLRATANGRMEPPEGLGNGDNSLGMSQVALIIIYMFMAIAGGVLFLAIGGPILAIGWVGFLAFAYPGATMSLAIDMNLGHALNPLTPLAIMERLGWPYFVVALLTLMFVFSQANAEALLAPILPGPFDLIIAYALSNYVTIATFHLMGYLIYQYHDELGYEVDAPLALSRAKSDPDQDVIDESEALARDGKLDQAAELLAGHLRQRGGSEVLHQRYRKILTAKQDTPGLLAHGNQWVTILVAQENYRPALNVARDCIALDASFRPQHPEEIHVLADAAQKQSQSQLALQLVSGFHKNHPKHKHVPKNLLLAAQLMAERFNQEDKARTLLKQVKERYPDHDIIEDVDKYLVFLNKLSAPAQGS